MPDTSYLEHDLRTLGARRTQLLADLDRANADLDALIHKADQAGIGPTAIAHLAQVSRPTVYAALKRAKKDTP